MKAKKKTVLAKTCAFPRFIPDMPIARTKISEEWQVWELGYLSNLSTNIPDKTALVESLLFTICMTKSVGPTTANFV